MLAAAGAHIPPYNSAPTVEQKKLEQKNSFCSHCTCLMLECVLGSSLFDCLQFYRFVIPPPTIRASIRVSYFAHLLSRGCVSWLSCSESTILYLCAQCSRFAHCIRLSHSHCFLYRPTWVRIRSAHLYRYLLEIQIPNRTYFVWGKPKLYILYDILVSTFFSELEQHNLVVSEAKNKVRNKSIY